MPEFLSIGGKVVNLAAVVAVYDSVVDDRATTTMRFAGDDNYIRFRGEDRALLLAWMARQERLLSEQDEMRRQIVSDAYNPFIDEEKLTVIYSLFCEIATHGDLLLCLESEEVGSIRYKADTSIAVEWTNAVEAVDRLHAYRLSLRAGEDIS